MQAAMPVCLEDSDLEESASSRGDWNPLSTSVAAAVESRGAAASLQSLEEEEPLERGEGREVLERSVLETVEMDPLEPAEPRRHQREVLKTRQELALAAPATGEALAD